MGFFDDLFDAGLHMAANGIKNAIQNSINKQEMENCTVVALGFKPPFSYPFSNPKARNSLVNEIAEFCGSLIGIELNEQTNQKNWVTLYDEECCDAFVMTDGKFVIKYGMFGMGQCGLEISGTNCGRFVERLNSFLTDLKFQDIQNVFNQHVPFHESKWIEEAENFLVSNLNHMKKLLEEKQQAIELSIKFLTFLFGRRKKLSDDEKEFIKSEIENLYSDELKNLEIDVIRKIDKTYYKISHLQNSEEFFINNRINQISNDLKCLLFDVTCATVLGIFAIGEAEKDEDEAKIRPEYVYNFYLIRKNLKLSPEDEKKLIENIRRKYQLSQEQIDYYCKVLFSEETISVIKRRSPEILDVEIPVNKQSKENSKNKSTEVQEKTVVDFKIQIESEFKKIKNQLGEKANLVHLAYQSPEKLKQVIKSYAKNVTREEKPILIFDNSIFSRCKSGFLITDKHILIKNSFSFSNLCIDIANINDVQLEIPDNKISWKIKFDENIADCDQIGPEEENISIFYELIKLIIKNIKISKDINIPNIAEVLNFN